ncbi:F-box/FBD/LRR-repeat protein At1g13570-like [Silene latifolia]|uniref:F-box/FBD/LRR-repeat protein At1g13570-like n=1 Tax=Silene latifolia TaxID=37657 RepID=UPI003D785CE1
MTETCKRRRTVNVPSDLITELPRNVIDIIVEQLPLCDAAKMSVLSRNWLEIWRSKQKLVLDAPFFKRVLKDKIRDTREFSCIVSKILFHHLGHLLRFHLDIPCLKFCPDIDQWICYLSRTGVSDICIQNEYKKPIKLSSHIFSCGNLEKLKLRSFMINHPHNCGGFRKMTRLELDKTTLTEKAFKYLIHGCPLLQELRLTNFIGMEHVTIDAPKLSRLIVDGTYISLDVTNAEKLLSAVLGLQKCVDVCHKASLRVLIQALASSSKLQKLVFRGHFVKVLCKESLLPSSFENLRKLDLLFIHLNDVDDFRSIISIIQACPVVERLNISVSTSKHKTSHVLDYNPSSVLHRLCYADVDICRGSNMELKLIEFLLESSPILKKLSLTTSTGNIKTIFSPNMMHQLFHFRRASQNLKVNWPDSTGPDHSDSSDSMYTEDSVDFEDSEDSSSDDSGSSETDSSTSY